MTKIYEYPLFSNEEQVSSIEFQVIEIDGSHAAEIHVLRGDLAGNIYKGFEVFWSLKELREDLEKENLFIGCKGALEKAFPKSGIGGTKMYIREDFENKDSWEVVDMFDPIGQDEISNLSTVKDQYQYKKSVIELEDSFSFKLYKKGEYVEDIELQLFKQDTNYKIKVLNGFLKDKFYDGSYAFTALTELRKDLEQERLLIGCNGALKNVYPSRMAFDMGEGLAGYVMSLGVPATELVRIFSPASPSNLATVEEQISFVKEWQSSLKEGHFPNDRRRRK